MTTDTATEPGSRTVTVPVSAELLLRHLLCLDGDLVNAHVTRIAEGTAANGGGEPVLVLYVNVPNAPENAAELEPVYSRTACEGQARCPGQVRLAELQWRDGSGKVIP